MGRFERRSARYTRGLLLVGALAGCEAGDVDPSGGDAQPMGAGAGDGAMPFDAGTPMGDGAQPLADAGGAPAVDAAPSGANRMDGMLEAHNAVRAAVGATPALPPLTWRDDIAVYAQSWADELAAGGCDIMHRAGSELQAKGYGENIAFLPTRFGGRTGSAQGAVDAWASEKMCWTYGTLSGFGMTGTETCDVACYTSLHSDGCGHYTAIVSKRSTALGCGVATCASGGFDYDIWVCNYNPSGNIVGQAPY